LLRFTKKSRGIRTPVFRSWGGVRMCNLYIFLKWIVSTNVYARAYKMTSLKRPAMTRKTNPFPVSWSTVDICSIYFFRQNLTALVRSETKKQDHEDWRTLDRYVVIRVTRLGRYSPNGWLFTLGSYLIITEVSHNFWLLYSMVKFNHKNLQKLGWDTFWVIFLQTHPVTLVVIEVIGKLLSFRQNKEMLNDTA
jgi:hypothetical protein